MINFRALLEVSPKVRGGRGGYNYCLKCYCEDNLQSMHFIVIFFSQYLGPSIYGFSEEYRASTGHKHWSYPMELRMHAPVTRCREPGCSQEKQLKLVHSNNCDDISKPQDSSLQPMSMPMSRWMSTSVRIFTAAPRFVSTAFPAPVRSGSGLGTAFPLLRAPLACLGVWRAPA